MQISIVDYFCVYISNASDQCFKIEGDVIANVKVKEIKNGKIWLKQVLNLSLDKINDGIVYRRKKTR